MKKVGTLLLVVAVMAVSTSNVYGESFNIQSPGMDIFNTLNEDGLDKQDVEAWLGQSKDTEEMFHAVYDYSLGNTEGELKVRYDDAYPLGISKITNNINEYTPVGRILWKENEKYFPETYAYQIESLGDLDYDFWLDDVLETFQEVPAVIDNMISDDIEYTTIKYTNYPMFGEKGTLILTFEDEEIKKNSSWIFELPEGKTFSDYSEWICTSWLTAMSDIVELTEQEYGDESEAVFLMTCIRTVCDHYQKVFQEENKQEMKIFDSALRNFYLMLNGEDSKFGRDLEEWLGGLENFAEDGEGEVNSEEISEEFLKIWMSTDQCKYSWEQMIEQDYSEDHFDETDQPVSFYETTYDENLEEHNSKYIGINLNLESLIDEE